MKRHQRSTFTARSLDCGDLSPLCRSDSTRARRKRRQVGALQITVVALLSSLFTLHSSFGQGPLTPPGPPAPTFKTLQQIEPRTPITNATAVTISQSGSYYLTTNITVATGDAITISADGVTLDLNGFSVRSTQANPGSAGIFLANGLKNITIANGFIQGGVTNSGGGVYNGGGFAYGITGNPVNALVSRVSVSGCLFEAIYLGVGNSTVADSCTVRSVGGFGIVASTIKSSVAMDCGYTAIYGDQVSDCRGQCAGDSYSGIAATTAQNCSGYSSNSYGLVTGSAQNCYGQSSTSTGLYANRTALGCSGYSDSGAGLSADTAENCWGQSGGGGDGIHANRLALNCYGISSGGGTGVFAQVVQNSYGVSVSSYGVYAAQIAQNTYGLSTSGTGLFAPNASFCAACRTGGTAIQATIATGCLATCGTNNVGTKYNMP